MSCELRADHRSKQVTTTLHLLGLFALDLLVFKGVYFSADSFPGDFGATHYGQVAYWIASVTAGEWPSWMPYAGMGYPLAINPESGILYPPFWVFPALHLPYTLKAASILQALHVFGGAVGIYALSRRLFDPASVALVMGVAYVTYGGFYSNAAHPDIVRAFALLPWLLWGLSLINTETETGTSALSATNLFVPIVAYFVVTGAYPGNVIAFFLAAAAFVVAQAARNAFVNHSVRGSALDAVALFGLLGLGVLMASSYLLPTAAGAQQLTRVAGGPLSGGVMHYLQVRDLLELVVPNSWLHPTDNEMYGMQLPVALFPFVLMVGKRMLVLLTPFVAVIALSLFMALDVFSGATSMLAQRVSIFGLSRFPSGDYRTCIALGVLLLCGAGLNEAIKRRRVHDFVLAAVVFVCGVPTLIDARTNWQVADAEKYLVDDSGVNLWPDGKWLPDLSAQRHLTERPVRDSRRHYPNDVAWNAYLQRDFLMGDYGGVVLTARRAVERNPELRSFMQGPSKLVAIPCTSPSTGVTLNQDVSSFEWRLTDYSAERLQYSIYTASPSVIVENELYADGWTARLDQSESAMLPVKVDDALRGWRLPAGEHQLTVSFETPMFGVGIACSIVGVAFYGLLIGALRVNAPVR